MLGDPDEVTNRRCSVPGTNGSSDRSGARRRSRMSWRCSPRPSPSGARDRLLAPDRELFGYEVAQASVGWHRGAPQSGRTAAVTSTLRAARRPWRIGLPPRASPAGPLGRSLPHAPAPEQSARRGPRTSTRIGEHRGLWEGRHPLGERDGFFECASVVDDPVGQPDGHSFRARHLTGGQEEIQRASQPDELGKAHGGSVTHRDAPAMREHCETRRCRSDPQVTPQREAEATRACRPLDGAISGLLS